MIFLTLLFYILHLVRSNQWSSIAEISPVCPRFVCFDMQNEGMGDMIGRLIVTSAIAVSTQSTLVFTGKFWERSTRHASGYQQIFEDELGIPISRFLLLSDVRSKWNPKVVTNIRPDELLFHGAEIFNDHPCNTLIHSQAMNTCSANGKPSWCLSTILNVAQQIMTPLLAESLNTVKAKRRLHQPMQINKINIVWHLRTGDVCLNCESRPFFNNIFNLIKQSLDMLQLEYVNLVVFQPESRVENLFKDIPNTIYMNNTSPLESVRYFMNADILVTAGSSFPNAVSLFTPLHKPLVLQALDKDATPEYHVMINNPLKPDTDKLMVKYFLNEGRAVRLDKDGRALSFSAPDVAFVLTTTGAAARAEKAARELSLQREKERERERGGVRRPVRRNNRRKAVTSSVWSLFGFSSDVDKRAPSPRTSSTQNITSRNN